MQSLTVCMPVLWVLNHVFLDIYFVYDLTLPHCCLCLTSLFDATSDVWYFHPASAFGHIFCYWFGFVRLQVFYGDNLFCFAFEYCFNKHYISEGFAKQHVQQKCMISRLMQLLRVRCSATMTNGQHHGGDPPCHIWAPQSFLLTRKWSHYDFHKHFLENTVVFQPNVKVSS